MHHYQHCHHHRVLLFPGGAKNCQHNPPTTIHPIIRRHSKHNVSSGCFDAVCITMKYKESKQSDRWEGSRDTQTVYSVSVKVKGENANPLCTMSHIQTRPVPTLKASFMELNMRTVSYTATGTYWQGESQMQSITLPVCLIISHQERWPAKINWLFHRNNPSGKTMIC